MPRMIIAIDGVVIKEVDLTKDRTTLGRRPYNDIVIDNLAVSGEHAVLHMHGTEVEIEDLGSTNGTYVNAKAVKRQLLRSGDLVEMGKYKIRFLQDGEGANFEKTMLFKPGMAAAPASAAPAPSPLTAIVRVLSGAAAGRELVLQKVVTTVGKPGVAVASITRQHHGFVLAHVEGPEMPMLNGAAIGDTPAPIKNGDRLALAGIEMEFEQR